MKLLASPAELRSELARLLERYSRFSCAVAWAGSDFPLEKLLQRHRRKMDRVVVGTHFFQTHPNFINRYRRNSRVRFVLETNGVFHPKLYFFENSVTDWACVVGSPNFTHGAFHKNVEIAAVFDSHSVDAGETRKQILAFHKKAWSQSTPVSAAWLRDYRAVWDRNISRRSALGASVSSRRAGRRAAGTESGALLWSWREYMKHVTADPHHDFDERLAILKIFRGYFEKVGHFHKMNRAQREQIAGVAEDSDHKWRYFGSMKGAGRFRSVVRQNDPYLSKAIDSIPLHGPVSQKQFFRYRDILIKAFPGGGCQIGVASRLLAMKRPDLFLCIDGPNRHNVAVDFGATNARLSKDFEFYWSEVIERIHETEWWCEPRPLTTRERRIWAGRAALLDAVYYDPLAKVAKAREKFRVFVVGCNESTNGYELKPSTVEWNLPNDAAKDDLILIYRNAPTSAIRDVWKVKGQFSVYAKDNKKGRKPGRQGWLRKLVPLMNFLTRAELIRDKTTKDISLVRKNFRGKTEVTKDWPKLYRKIIEINPEAAALLKSFRPV